MTRAFAKTATITVSAVVAVIITICVAAPKSRAIAPLIAPGIIISVLSGAWLLEHFQGEEEEIKKKLTIKRLERCLNDKEAAK